MAKTAQAAWGIGLGAENCYIGVTREGGIEVILNEYSQYSTPAYIGLGGNQRDLGTSAKQKQLTHLKTTYFAPSLLLDKKFSELDIGSLPFSLEQGPDDSIQIRVQHAGKELLLTPVQILAMLFTKLRSLGENFNKCVINCPNYFTDVHRRQMLDAAKIAGLKDVNLINDTTAVALFYFFFRNTSEFSILCFFDCGQSSCQSSIFFFNRKDNCLYALDTQFEADIGGRDFDKLIADYFIEKQKLPFYNEQGKIEERYNRARYRLLTECEKLKKQMSANYNELPISVEFLYDEKDFSDRMDRATFVKLAEAKFKKIEAMFKRNLAAAEQQYIKKFAESFGPFKLDSVEIFGGSSRIPEIKEIIQKVFRMNVSTTLNADEAVARGCALQSACSSSKLNLEKAPKLYDSMCYDVLFEIRSKANDPKLKTIKFFKGTHYPVVKKVVIPFQKLPLQINIIYVDTDEQKKNSSEYLVEQASNIDLSTFSNSDYLTFYIDFDLNGCVSLSQARISYEKNHHPSMNFPKDEINSDEEVNPNCGFIALSIKTVKNYGKLSDEELNEFIKKEQDLIQSDKDFKDKTDAKNALEEFIFEWRAKLSDFAVYVQKEENKAFNEALDQAENWLNAKEDENENLSKLDYDAKKMELETRFTNKILSRKYEFENYEFFLKKYEDSNMKIEQFYRNSSREFKKEKIAKLLKKFIDKNKCMHKKIYASLSQNNANSDPEFTCKDIQEYSKKVNEAFKALKENRTEDFVKYCENSEEQMDIDSTTQ